MLRNFGNTWWGNEWLKALTHINYMYRLSRGATYARKGLVKKFKFSKGIFSAHVQGTHREVYKILLGIPQFTQEEIDRLMNSIMTRPILISKLLNRKLDSEIINICKQSAIRLFPISRNDISMDCSCPDWAGPCKHLAALIYQISLEIDNNPFLVFKMHGVDLIDELDKRNIKIQAKRMMEPVDVETLLQPKEKKISSSIIRKLPVPDFSKIDNLLLSLTALLPNTQSFYSRDFKAVYLDQMNLIAKKATQLIEGRLQIEYNEIKDVSEIIQIQTFNFLLKVNLPYALIGISPEQTASANVEVELLRLFAYFALYLLKNGAVIPQILHLEKGYAVRWLPATLNSEVEQLTSMLYEAMPDRKSVV